ncbi:hypothetical protein CP989_24985, partial [Enterobacter hormaechei]|uniref:hypothetical protein n=1 Tax=Enterobacter hormaechei TaxID=158836 RepID=UPI000BD0155A
HDFRNVGIGIKMDTTESGIQLRAAVCDWLEKSLFSVYNPGAGKTGFIRIRGRATVTSLLHDFRNVGIGIKMDTTESGIQLRAAVCDWLEKS